MPSVIEPEKPTRHRRSALWTRGMMLAGALAVAVAASAWLLNPPTSLTSPASLTSAHSQTQLTHPGSGAAATGHKGLTKRSNAYELAREGGPFRAYEDFRVALARGVPAGADETLLPRLLRDDDTDDDDESFHALEKAIESGAGNDAIYLAFIRAHPHFDVMYEYLEVMLKSKVAEGQASTKRGQIYGWGWVYSARAALELYRATSDQRLLRLVAESYEQILADRDWENGRIDDFRAGALRSWGTTNHVEGQYTSVVTIAGRIAFVAASFASIVQADPSLETEFGEQAQRFLRSAQEAMAEFDSEFFEIPGTDRGLYRRPTRGDYEPLNHAHCAGEALLALYDATGDESYRRRAELLARFFLSVITPHENGSITWPYASDPGKQKQDPGERIWKAQITIGFPLAAYERGLFFTDAQMTSMASCFRNNVHRGGVNFNTFIDPEPFTPLGGTNRDNLLAGWIVLDRFDPEIRTIIEQAVAQRHDIFRAGWFDYPSVALACVHRLVPQRPLPRSLRAQPACGSFAFEKHAWRHDRQAIEGITKQRAEVSRGLGFTNWGIMKWRITKSPHFGFVVGNPRLDPLRRESPGRG